MESNLTIDDILKDSSKKLKLVRKCHFHKLRNDLNRAKDKKDLEIVKQTYSRINKSIEDKKNRLNRFKKITPNKSLPIYNYRSKIIDAIKNNQIIILSGETGSGKTTQIPQFCIEAGRGIEGKIACTQPRRIAALTVSQRIAEELKVKEGSEVTYKVRFQDNDNESSFIKLLTDGMLLAETQHDRFLNEYDTIIIDEAHERSLNIDFLLGLLRNLVKKRRDLKVIITSATIDVEKFSKAFENAPIFQVEGRTYPVETVWLDEELNDELTLAEQILIPMKEILSTSSDGDILIFLPTEQDIHETTTQIRSKFASWNLAVLPLFARMASHEQREVFKSFTNRKVIVSSNVAETSLTIDGIKYVVDSGLARIARYSPGSGTFSLPVEEISKSSADQRKGRCGRVENGICYRLFTKQNFDGRAQYTAPELLRTNLAEVILRMLSLKIRDIKGFPFIDNPSSQGINDGFKTLIELKAVKRFKGDFHLTNDGRQMSRLPIDPRLSRMLFQAKKEGCIYEAIIIAGLLSIQDPRERPKDKAQTATESRSEFKNDRSDFITLLNIWKQYELSFKSGRTSGIKKFCKKYYLSFKRMREWRDITVQIKRELEDESYKIKSFSGEAEALFISLHRSLVSGFLSHIALKKDKVNYQATNNRDAMIFPGSALFETLPTWLVSAEMVRTSRLYMRCCAQIDPVWLDELADHLIKSSPIQPRWSDKKGEVIANEKRTLYGFIVSNDRIRSYSYWNPTEAKQIFIDSLLVDIENNSGFSIPFIEKNNKLINESKKAEDKLRKRGFLIGERELALWYSERLPEISSIVELKKYIEKNGDYELLLNESDLFVEVPDASLLEEFPDIIETNEEKLKVSYSFAPGEKNDGITIHVKKNQIENIHEVDIEKSIPSFYREKIEHLFKTLPKNIRKELLPIKDRVDDFIENQHEYAQNNIQEQLSRYLYEKMDIHVSFDNWKIDELPERLIPIYRLENRKGKKIIETTNISELTIKSKKESDDFIPNELVKKWEKNKFSEYEWEVIPEVLSYGINGKKLFPGITEIEPSMFIVKLYTDQNESNRYHLQSIVSLINNSLKGNIKQFQKILNINSNMLYSNWGGPKEIEKRLWTIILGNCKKNIRNKKDYLDHIETLKESLFERAESLFAEFNKVIDSYTNERLRILAIEDKCNSHIKEWIEERKNELLAILPIDFPDGNLIEHSNDYIRLLKMVRVRTEKGVLNRQKDIEREELFIQQEEEFYKRVKLIPDWLKDDKKDNIESLFWYLQEFRISIFASPEIKCKEKISEQRLEKKFNELIL